MAINKADRLRSSNYPKGLLLVKPTTDKHILIEWIRTEFNLPASIGKLCEQFFLRIWSGNYVNESIQDGILHGRSESWAVHYQSTPEVVKSADKVACSFRTYQGKNYVVIKVWTEKETKETNHAS